jgi:hypothetical protein
VALAVPVTHLGKGVPPRSLFFYVRFGLRRRGR